MSKDSDRSARDEANRRSMEQFLRQLAASGQVTAALGRTLTPNDEPSGRPEVAVITHATGVQ